MAWYHGTYSCGHEGRVNIVGPEKDRPWKIEHHFSGLCPECYAKKVAEERAKALEDAQKVSEQMELPELEGSEKQVAWAETIRINVLKKMDELQTSNVEAKQYVKDRICKETKASFFIDNRDCSVFDFAKMYADDFRALSNKVAEDAKKESESIAKAEVAVKPESGNNVEVEISNTDGCIVAKCEKNDDARIIFKSVNMKWNNRWERKLNEYTGSYQDRAAELGNKLLNAGFTVVCCDENVRKNMVSGTFQQEPQYWIRTYEGYNNLFFKLYEKNDKLYSASRKIKGASWNSEKSAVEIPVSMCNDVVDFAEDCGIKISSGAEKLISKYKSTTENIVPVVPKKPKNQQNNLEKILKSGDEVLDDLKD